MTETKASTRWCFTLNSWTPDHEDTLKTVPCKYLVYGKEKGQSGTPHLQGFITFSKPKRLSALKKISDTAHWEITKGTSLQASDYCKKGSQSHDEWKEHGASGPNFGVGAEVFEDGIAPTPGKRTDLQGVCDMIKDGESLQSIASQHPETFIKFGRGIRDLKLTLDTKYTPAGTRGIWYWGAPGTGKSRKAREDNPDAYLKPQSKWFDGYNGEDVIILDDMDTNILGHYLKIWTDRYPCTGETKGGTINLQHDKFIVTSNYSIQQLWPDDKEMQAAILRRFEVTKFEREPVERHYLGGVPLTPPPSV